MQQSSSSDEDGLFTNKDQCMAARRSMKSLFAADAMQARHGVTSLRYEDPNPKDKSVSKSVMGGSVPGAAPNAPSPLQTAAQSLVMAFRGDVSIGACVIALCVPNANAPPAATALIAIVDREKRPQCRVRLDEQTQLIQNPSEPQYATLYDPSFGGHWSLMFRDRRSCTEFVAAFVTSRHCAEMESRPTPPFEEWGAESKNDEAVVLQRGDSARVSFMMWLLRRVPGTRYFSLGKLIDEVPPEAPREIVMGDGVMMIGVEEALLGMASDAARIVFVAPNKTHVRRGMGNPEVGTADSVVVHITCHAVHKGSMKSGDGQRSNEATRGSSSVLKEVPEPTEKSAGRTATVASSPQLNLATDSNSLLQAILLQTLQQQQQQQQRDNTSSSSSGGGGAIGSVSLDAVERGMDRIQIQLSSLYEKIDRLGIDDKLEKNNAAIERIVKKAVGKAPTNDADVEDMLKDSDALLATIERLKGRLEEETGNYHRALEAMGRHKDEVHHLQNDLRIQQETNTARERQVEEQRRLQLIEAEVRHRESLERLTDEKYTEGRKVGFAEGVAAGRQAALEAVGGHSEDEWRERLFASEQSMVRLQTEMQQREAHHLAERRRMQDEMDALHAMTEKLERRLSTAATRQNGPDNISYFCKKLRRAMNATYTHIETQLLANRMEGDKVAVEDVLQMVLFAVKSETRTFSDEFKKEATFLDDFEEIHPAEAHDAEEAGEAIYAEANDGHPETEPEVSEPRVEVNHLPPAPPHDTIHALFRNDNSEEYPEPPFVDAHGGVNHKE